MSNIEDIIVLGKIIPVVTLADAADAIPVADALYEGGIKTIEITMRTRAAADAIRSLENHPIVVGAGTITDIGKLRIAQDAGAKFFISPGFTAKLAEESAGLAYLPGVTTTSEIMRALGYGYKYLKFFPAEASGGVNTLQNFAAIFPEVKFCPTGGINEAKVKQYLSLRNVPCIGGSWIVKYDDVQNKNWVKIKGRAKVASMNS